NKYPRARIIAVEPEEANFTLLGKNTMPFKDIICLNKALWNRECVLQLLDNGNGNASFVTSDVTTRDKVVNRIDTVTITGIIEEYGIEQLDLVKLDIEGSEKNIFEKNYEEWLSKTRDIIVEIHPHLNPGCESTVMNALNTGFTKSTIGEYCHFSRNNSA
ncbi:MAG: FkbM family methyltransferase, partial [Ginsengibacter sp.]